MANLSGSLGGAELAQRDYLLTTQQSHLDEYERLVDAAHDNPMQRSDWTDAGRRYFPAAAAAAVSALRLYRARAQRFRLTPLKAAASLEHRTPGYFCCSAKKSALQSHPADSSDL